MPADDLKKELQEQRAKADASIAQPRQPNRPTDLAIDYFYNETIEAMKLAGYKDDEINKSSYVKNLKTFLAMDPELDKKMNDEVNNQQLQAENRKKRFLHERAAFSTQHPNRNHENYSSDDAAYEAAQKRRIFMEKNLLMKRNLGGR